ncbi:DNA repair protein RadC [uncultured Acidaminococcus sp.]|uniref:RadC family protein n=1 Tax=uncultured Acidaminococcus sp. TaxID=352152 RepID=UPI0026376F94|nr:DNA repair protein RadC [uncultured Acidaminococcus sp.]
MTHYLIREMLPEERPRERLMAHGPEALTITELLAILIGSGRKDHSALDIARELTGDLMKDARLARTQDVRELTRIPGIGPAKAAVILAALELGRRLAEAESQPFQAIHCPEDGAMLVMPRLRYETHEHFLVMLLNSKGKVTGIEPVSEGSLNASVVHPREAFAPALLHHAAAILAVHNHPSGDPTPSREDRELTKTLWETGKVMGIPLVDHLIIGDGIYYSFKEHGLM